MDFAAIKLGYGSRDVETSGTCPVESLVLYQWRRRGEFVLAFGEGFFGVVADGELGWVFCGGMNKRSIRVQTGRYHKNEIETHDRVG